MERSETATFASRTADDFKVLLSARERASLAPVDVTAQLWLPEAASPVPLVITSIGSGGFASGREVLYAGVFAAAGIAMLAVNSFDSRGFSETRTDQGRISMATSCADAVYALDYMARDPRIDAKRIALFGYSRGGGAVLMTSDDRFQGAIAGDTLRFAAYVALYPSVWLRWLHPHPAPGPGLIVLAENDDMAPLGRQMERVEALRGAGATLETAVVPGAGHSFDSLDAARYRPDGNRCEWDIAVGDDGMLEETVCGVLQTADWADFLRSVGAARGTGGGTTGHGGAPRTAAAGTIVDFLKRTLG